LIVEELIRQEAQKANIEVPESELSAYVAQIRSSFSSAGDQAVAPKPLSEREMAAFLKAVRLRQQLEKLAQTVVPREVRPSSQKWRAFWGDWLARMPKGPVYRARVLFIQASDEALAVLKAAWKKELSLSELEVQVRIGGYATLLSRVLTVNPLDPTLREMFGQVDLRAALAQDVAKPPYLTPIFRLPNSYAVLEVLEIRPAPEPDELARAAQKAYERQAGQEAFQAWVDRLRQKAEVVVNPNYPDLEEVGSPPAAKPASKANPPQAPASPPPAAGPGPKANSPQAPASPPPTAKPDPKANPLQAPDSPSPAAGPGPKVNSPQASASPPPAAEPGPKANPSQVPASPSPAVGEVNP
jgi:hypothetical protein